jgi:aminocarboxymuconate-semialdehyde decarboxylase
VRPEAQRCAHEPSSYLKKLWFDTVVHDPAAVRHLVDVAGAGRVLLGSDFPFDMGLDDPVAFVRAADLPAELTERILAANAEALLSTRVPA